MIKRLLVGFGLSCGVLCSTNLGAQVLLSEDFTGTTGSTPPTGWSNTALSGTETWYFDNPGSRTLTSPISSPAAIFDSDYNGGSVAEDAVLESPTFDASSGTILLTFDHYFYSGFGGAYAVEVYNGTVWDTIAEGSSLSTSNPQSESFDITSLTGGSTAAKIRFHWIGDYSWYWIVDNITVTAVSCLPPTSLSASAITTSTADLSWTTGGASLWNVEYGVAGFTPGTGTLVNATNDTTTISGLSANTTYEFYVRDSCGLGDSSPWTGPYSFTTLCSAINTFPALEDFAGGWPPSCWEEGDGGDATTGPTALGAGGWATDGFANNGTTGAVRINLYNTGDMDWIISPAYDLSSGGPYQMEFDFGVFAWNTSTPATLGSDDEIQVLVSTDMGSTWSVLDTYDTTYVTAAAGNHEVYDLTSYTGTVVFAIWASEGTVDDLEDNDIFVDNFQVRAIPSCSEPSVLGAFNITANAASLFWTAGAASNWDIEYDTSGFTLGTGTMLQVTNDTFNLTGLTPAYTYDFYVRDSCGVGNTSQWVGPFTFTTQCLTDTIPYLMDFDNGSFPSCWSNSNSTYVTVEATCDTRTNVLEFNYTEEATTGEIDASGAQSIRVGYYIGAGACINDPEDNEHFQVLYWDGAAWVLAKDYDGTMPQAFVWDSFVVPQSALTSSFKVKFDMIDGTTDSWEIDSVVIEEGPSCVPPAALGAANITVNSADIYWVSGGASNWNVEYGTLGFTLGTGTMLNATNDTVSLTGLSSSTTYEFYVRDSCAVGDVSAWAGPFSFATLCAIFPAPFMESFTGTDIPLCWNQDAATGGPWQFTWTSDPDFGSTNAFPDHTAGVSGANYTWVDMSSTDDSVVLELPVIDVSALTNPELSFWVVSTTSNTAIAPDFNKLYAEAFNGTSWVAIDSVQGDFGLQWVEFTVDLTPYVSSSLVTLRFRQESGGASADYDNDMLLDDIEVRETVVSGCTVAAPNLADEIYCVPGSTILYAAAGNKIVNFNTTGWAMAGDSLEFAFNGDTSFVVYHTASGPVKGNVGPLTNIATAGYGNFTNGQWITVMDTIIIDSMTVNANGVVEAQVVISNMAATTEIQRGEIFTTGSATGDYIVPVGVVLTPGTYFMNVDFLAGTTGQLFRATGGASYPYTLAGLMSIDSTNFSSQARIYYTFDLMVSEACVSAADSVGITVAGTNAGADNKVFVCDNAGSVDLTTYLSTEATAGGTFVTASAGGLITGNMFDPSINGSGTYMIQYIVAGLSSCPGDTAVLSLTVSDCSNCTNLMAPVAMNDSLCGAGTATLSAATTATDIMWTDANGEFLTYGSSIDIGVTSTTNLLAHAIISNPAPAHIGPDVTMNNNAYPSGNFTNGQWITVYNDLRIDSIKFAVNGALDFVVAILNADETDTLQLSKVVSFAGADTAHKEVGIYLTPGTYFMRSISIAGSGVLWRPLLGASYPYAVNDLLSVDSSDFGDSRYYYFYDMIVSGACMSGADTAVAVVDTNVANAGADNSVTVCDTLGMVDLSMYLDASATMGGTFVDANATGALSGSMFDVSVVTDSSSYMFYYVVSSAGGICPSDTATITVFVDDCEVSLNEYTSANLSLFPNPTQGVVTVQNLGNATQQMVVEVYSLNGALMLQQTYTGENEVTLDISNLTKGVYTFKVTTDNEVMVERVIKR